MKDGTEIRGQTQIVEPTWAWLDDQPGRRWRPRQRLAEFDEPRSDDRLSWSISAPMIVLLALGSWIIVASAVVGIVLVVLS